MAVLHGASVEGHDGRLEADPRAGALLAWGLLRNILTLHDSEATGQALRAAAVAAALEEDARMCVPLWLTDGFLGDRHVAWVTPPPADASGDDDGGRSPEEEMEVDEAHPRDDTGKATVDETRRTGHPSKLLELYMRQGLLMPACEWVKALLLAGTDTSAKGESTRFDGICSRGLQVWLPYTHIDRLLHLTHHRVDALRRRGETASPLETALTSLEELLEVHFLHLIMAEAIVSPTPAAE